jgi:hypothetical protein
MAFTQTQLDNLESAIATGSLSCEFDGKRVQYRSLDEMMRIRETMRSALGLAGSAKRFSLAGFTKDSSQPTRSTVPDPFGTNVIG